jgi:hypothetical protein
MLWGLENRAHEKQKGTMRDTISTKENLVSKLLFIATGWSYEDLRFLFDLSPNILAQPH